MLPNYCIITQFKQVTTFKKTQNLLNSHHRKLPFKRHKKALKAKSWKLFNIHETPLRKHQNAFDFMHLLPALWTEFLVLTKCAEASRLLPSFQKTVKLTSENPKCNLQIHKVIHHVKNSSKIQISSTKTSNAKQTLNSLAFSRLLADQYYKQVSKEFTSK